MQNTAAVETRDDRARRLRPVTGETPIVNAANTNARGWPAACAVHLAKPETGERVRLDMSRFRLYSQPLSATSAVANSVRRGRMAFSQLLTLFR